MRLYRLAALSAATLLAALAPALVVGLLSQSLQILPFALSVTLGHTIVLGLPCFFILESGRGVNLISALKAGFAIGALPLGILGPVPAGGTYIASTNRVPTVVNGVRTLAGWL
jgi:hypothetical protein